MAAVLAVGPGAVLSHRDAARLHEIRFADGAKVDVSTPEQRRSTTRVRVHARRLLDAPDITTVDGIAVTTVSRTLVDLAEVLPHQALVTACSEAERQRKLDVRAIEDTLARLRGRRGPGHVRLTAALEDLAAHGAQLTRSRLEDRLAPLLDAHGLPRPQHNFHVAGMEGDAAWPAARLAVELDGWDAHKTRRAFQGDRAKSNALQAAGWVVLRYTHADVVRRPRQVVAEIAAQLARSAA